MINTTLPLGKKAIGNAIILVGYNLFDTVYTLGVLDALFEEIDFSEKVLIWNNANDHLSSLLPTHSTWSLIRGTNVHHEFSGWQEGLEKLQHNPSTFRYIVFANDTIASPRSDTRKSGLLKEIKRILACKSLNGAVGLLHHSAVSKHGIELDDTVITEWMCTGCFALTGSLIGRLQNRIDYSLASKSLIAQQEDLIVTHEASGTLSAHIENWLTNNVSGWYAARPYPLSDEDLIVLRNKALMVINEIVLSSKIKRTGATFYDPTRQSLKPHFINRIRSLMGLILPQRLYRRFARIRTSVDL